MTIAQLEQLLQQYFPQAAAPATQQGRALVTDVTPLRFLEHPCECGCGKMTTLYRKYCSNACRQKAYRQRKKAAA